jgi:prevent-host-death family protein
MENVGTFEVKTHLSGLLRRVAQGESFTITRNGVPVAKEVSALSRREGLTAYDAAYLELAMREGLPLATLDRQLREAAARLGVPEFQP